MCEPKTLEKQRLLNNDKRSRARHRRRAQKLRFHNDNNKSKCKMALRDSHYINKQKKDFFPVTRYSTRCVPKAVEGGAEKRWKVMENEPSYSY